jgi:hypothetical protein
MKTYPVGAMWMGRATILTAGLLVLIGLLLTAKSAHAETFTVNSKQDFNDINHGDGVCYTIDVVLLSPCTLRGAIQEANAFAGPDIIDFDIPLSGVQTIKPNSQLPTVTAPVTIDGYTQGPAIENTLTQGSNAVLRIELDGSSAQGSLPDGLVIGASNCDRDGPARRSVEEQEQESQEIFLGPADRRLGMMGSYYFGYMMYVLHIWWSRKFSRRGGDI